VGASDIETKVKAILDTAGLLERVSDEELAVFVRLYPEVRAMAERLYIPETVYEEPALVFSAEL
jgi:hypothetical protein